ncbi:myo-inositol-1(or 4)-monophosphatase [Salsuginibacillus halophilus]|uniref:Myo-inositol-1(Or 4)-monophosphatase n=1 Tax=Salsuginibacillus halophilus TaxID=517424 RepID=A0A2P8HX89_9BACI|nr:inositol monophosphatase family protein [Salsuginibacillus halophilus]PSL50840.1 myo-inositol-1(or 4)-monophosphatase [Salsuginibacillus halophilus]
MEQDTAYLYEQACNFVAEASRLLEKPLQENALIESKRNVDDLVTEMDRAVEELFRRRVTEYFPAHGIVGEESGEKAPKNGCETVWYIDPIDGTTNFVHQHHFFVISVGIYEEGHGKIGIIYDVMQQEWFSAVRGEGAWLNNKELPKRSSVKPEEAIFGLNGRWLIYGDKQQVCRNLTAKVRSTRCYGAAALEFAYVAAGRLDGYISMKLSSWDYAAGFVLLEETGCSYQTVQGGPVISFNEQGIAAAVPGLDLWLQKQLQETGIDKK